MIGTRLGGSGRWRDKGAYRKLARDEVALVDFAFFTVVYQPWKWVCYLPVICLADSTPYCFLSLSRFASFLNSKIEQAVAEDE